MKSLFAALALFSALTAFLPAQAGECRTECRRHMVDDDKVVCRTQCY